MLDDFARLHPSFRVDGTLFQHIDPHLDPSAFEDLWSFPSNADESTVWRVVPIGGS